MQEIITELVSMNAGRFHAFVRGMSGVRPTYARRTVKVVLNAGPSGGRVGRSAGQRA